MRHAATPDTRRGAHPASRPASRGGVPLSAVAPDDTPGCGWFDSSHDLLSGLSITEHDSPDRVAPALTLDVWLAWHLAGAPSRPGGAPAGV